VVLLIESFEAQVDFVEVSEHLASQLGELMVHHVEPSIDRGELTGDLGELAPEEFDKFLMLG